MNDASPHLIWLLTLMAGVMLDLAFGRLSLVASIPGPAEFLARLAGWGARKLDRARRSNTDRTIRGLFFTLFIAGFGGLVGAGLDRLFPGPAWTIWPAAILIAFAMRCGSALGRIDRAIREEKVSPERAAVLLRELSTRLADHYFTVALAFGLAGFTGLMVWLALASTVRAGTGNGLQMPPGPFWHVPLGLYQVCAIVGSFLASLAIITGGMLLRKRASGASVQETTGLVLVLKMPSQAIARALGVRIGTDPGQSGADQEFIGPESGRRAITADDLRSARLLAWFSIILLLIVVSILAEALS